MKPDRVALLIDADNVSIDVIEQAVAWVAKHYGGPHLRRAYCTPEAAVKHQDAFKRLSVRPMVNLAAGKNSTDIALAVDAIEIAVNEQPDVLVIASSDSDFAPVVARLRERGCRVVGLGQHGKVGQETRGIYDDYEVFEHRGGEDAAPAPRARAPRARAGTTRTRARTSTSERAPSKKAAKTAGAAKKAAVGKTAKKARAGTKSAGAQAQVPMPLAAPEEALHEPVTPERPARKTARKVARKAGVEPEVQAAFESAGKAGHESKPRTRREAGDGRSATTLDAVLRALPELGEGATLNFNDVGQRLRAAGLLSKSGSSMKLLRQFAGDVILEPADRPSRVRLAVPG
jgi:uncharacterized protein (TIGR00288 family)